MTGDTTSDLWARPERAVVALGRGDAEPGHPALAQTPHLAALARAGTRHVYADTADVEELGRLAVASDGTLRREIDGNTANQPLVHEVASRYLDAGDAGRWARELGGRDGGLSGADLQPLLYAVLCARVGNDMARAFGAGRAWEVSLQLHMALRTQPERARRVGHILRRAVPSALVKVPFAPDAPDCFLVARDLERAGIPVNFTSTFSARQAVAAALLSDVTRTNVFMGRLDQGLGAERLGEHVDLEAQRALRALRERDGTRTQLIVASMRGWRSFVRAAGCDVFTAPCSVLREFLEQGEVPPEAIESRLDVSHEDRLGVDAGVRDRLGAERIARLYRVEPELLEFLRELRRDPAYGALDGEGLHARFDRAGFGDLFHAPDAAERAEMEAGKLPDLDGRLVDRVPLDTHYSLLANADFDRHQAAIDAEIERRLAR